MLQNKPLGVWHVSVLSALFGIGVAHFDLNCSSTGFSEYVVYISPCGFSKIGMPTIL
jgi:hypothetical protein